MHYVHTVKPGSRVRLDEIDPADTRGIDKQEAEKLNEALTADLDELEDLLFEAGQHALLIVLQGRDTSGKDGTIRHLLRSMNVQSCRVAPFKVPTPIELAHDFLWRVHAVTPGKGGVTIFNRSHYEDVLVVRVHSLVPESVWRPRYEHINNFERLLADSNTILLKFMLHISKDEQERRLLDREKEVQKAWKLNVGDWKEREFWDETTAAFDEALERCSTEYAPWHIVPADRKWFRNLAVTDTIVRTLRDYREGWLGRLEKIGQVAKAEIDAWRAERSH